MSDNMERLECGRDPVDECLLPGRPSIGEPPLLPGRRGEGVLPSLDWFDIALMTLTTSPSQPAASARAARDREVDANTAS